MELVQYRLLRYGGYVLAISLALAIGRAASWRYYLNGNLKQIAQKKADGGFFAVNTFNPDGVSAYDPHQPSLIAYGDSANDSFHPADPEGQRKFITEFLQEAVTPQGIRVYSATRDGFGPEVFLSHFRFATSQHKGIDFAVFPINLEWLSPMRRENDEHFTRPRLSWEFAALRYPWLPLQVDFVFQPNQFGYKYRHNRGETAVGDIEWAEVSPLKQKTQRHYPNSRPTFSEEERVYWDNAFLLAFAHHLKEEDPLVKVVSAIQNVCDHKKVRCLFYLTPLNVNHLEKNPHLHAALHITRRNVVFLKDFARKKDIALLDMLEDAKSYQFNDYCSPHVTWQVRRFISHCVAEALQGRRGEVDCPVTRANLYPLPEGRSPSDVRSVKNVHAIKGRS